MKALPLHTARPLFVFLSFFILLLTVAVPTFAQETQETPAQAGFLVTPPTFELSANPGDTLTNTVRVENISDTPLEITVDKRRFVARGEEGAVELVSEDNELTLSGWMQVSPASVVLEPKASQTFTIFTQVPENAEPGGHFASVVFTSGKADPNAQGASVVQEIGVLSLLKVAGTVEEEWGIVSFDPAQWLFETSPVLLNTRVENTGNIHVKLTGTITITDLFGRVVDTVEIEPKNVLPDAIRLYDATWDTNQLIGRYQATVSMASGPESKIDTASTTFVIFPYKPVAVISVVLIIILLLLYRSRGRLGRSLKVLLRG